MENKPSKKIKILMGVILLLFLVPSGFDLARGFSEGWRSVDRETELHGDHSKEFRSFFVHLEPVQSRDHIRSAGDGHVFLPFEETGQLIVDAGIKTPFWVLTLRVVFSLGMVVLLVWFVVLLFRFAGTLSRRRIMAEENIRSLRKIAYMLGAFSLSGYLMQSVEILWLRSHISLEGYRIVWEMPPASLIVALIILVMTEILKLGYKLQQEQDLTI